MAYMIDSAYDAGLNYVRTNATALYICSQEPTTLAEATTTYALGSKSSPTINAPSNRSPNGRECVVAAISDGTVSADGTATHWAIVSGTELLATNTLTQSQAVTNGNPFTLAQFAFAFPDVVSA